MRFPINRVVLGIDPGKHGALCALRMPLEVTKQYEITVIDMPFDEKGNIDQVEIKNFISDHGPFDRIVIEKPIFHGKWNAQRQQFESKSNPESIGGLLIHVGELVGLCKIYNPGAEISLVQATTWHAEILKGYLGGDSKSNARKAVSAIFRGKADELAVGPLGGYKDGRGDAILIAYYGLEYLLKEVM